MVPQLDKNDALITPTNLRAIRKNLQKQYPLDQTPAFADLLVALDTAGVDRQKARCEQRMAFRILRFGLTTFRSTPAPG
jgi:hypothetical protein